jgi:hypothetical protein
MLKVCLPLHHIVSFMSLFKIYETLFQSSQVVRDGRRIVGDLKALSTQIAVSWKEMGLLKWQRYGGSVLPFL